MSGEAKLAILFGVTIGAVIGGFAIDDYIRRRQELQKKLADNEFELKKAELEGAYPPEYWTAKAAAAAADAGVRKAAIESEERLTMDARERRDAEQKAIREFEKAAPAEYWEQKRIEEEQRTKRVVDRNRHEAEIETAKLHNRAIEESAKAAERAIKQSLGSYSGYTCV